MAYQDVWRSGQTLARGDRDCASRYAMVRDVVSAYARPVTVWDLGASLGYFGGRLAEECGAVSVLVDQRPALVEAVREAQPPRVIALTTRLSAGDLQGLAACEHADVVLALNLLHHLPDWAEALSAILSLGERVIIETPGRGDAGSAHYDASQQILAALEREQPELIGWSPSHVTPGVDRPLFLFRRPKTALASGYLAGARVRVKGAMPVRPHVIVSTQTEKTIQFDGEAPRPWVPGMNLWNWLVLDGSYPSRAVVRAAVDRACDGVIAHGDLRPWNFILQGDTVVPIDAGHRHTDDQIARAETLACIADPRRAYVA